MKEIKFETLYLPDGQLLSYHENYSTENERSFSIHMTLALYESHTSGTRHVYEFIFEGVMSASKTQYFKDHAFHIGAGNVSHGHVIDERTYVFILADGIIDIKTEKLTIKPK